MYKTPKQGLVYFNKEKRTKRVLTKKLTTKIVENEYGQQFIEISGETENGNKFISHQMINPMDFDKVE